MVTDQERTGGDLHEPSHGTKLGAISDESFKLSYRHAQLFSSVSKPFFGFAFRRQVFCKVPVESQQVLKCIVIFVSRHTAENSTRRGLPANDRCRMEFCRKQINDLCAIVFRKRLAIRRRHFSFANCSKDVSPPIDIFSGKQIRIERIDS